jgi:hypothetical protein
MQTFKTYSGYALYTPKLFAMFEKLATETKKVGVMTQYDVGLLLLSNIVYTGEDKTHTHNPP